MVTNRCSVEEEEAEEERKEKTELVVNAGGHDHLLIHFIVRTCSTGGHGAPASHIDGDDSGESLKGTTMEVVLR